MNEHQWLIFQETETNSETHCVIVQSVNAGRGFENTVKGKQKLDLFFLLRLHRESKNNEHT